MLKNKEQQHRLSVQQELLLAEIRSYWSTHGQPPSAAELAEKFGRTRQNIYQHLRNLNKLGLLSKHESPAPNAAQRPEKAVQRLERIEIDPQDFKFIQFSGVNFGRNKKSLRLKCVPILNQTLTGEPIFSNQFAEESIWLEWSQDDDLFALRVRGHSLIDIGIVDGDIVILRRQPAYANGDIVLALVEGEGYSLKKLRRENDTVYLIPENREMKISKHHVDHLSIQGKLMESRRIYAQ